MSKANGRKSIFITGAASGMGRETARLFHQKGWFVGGLRRERRRSQVARSRTRRRQLRRAQARRHRHRDDYRVGACGVRGGDRMARWTFSTTMPASVAAACSQTSPFEDVMAVVNTNFVGVLIGIHEGVKYLKATPNSMCFTTSSSSATYGMPGIAVYSATKHAVKGLTEALAVEFKAIGVRAADVLPGLIDTPILPPGVAAAAPKGRYVPRHPADRSRQGRLGGLPLRQAALVRAAGDLRTRQGRDARTGTDARQHGERHALCAIERGHDSMSDDLVGEVAPAQRFDEAKLKAYLEGQIEGFGTQHGRAADQGRRIESDVQADDRRSKRTACAMSCARSHQDSCSRARIRSTANIA